MTTVGVDLGTLTISVVLVRELLVSWSQYQGARGRRMAVREQLRAEREIHHLAQAAVVQMLAAVRRR